MAVSLAVAVLFVGLAVTVAVQGPVLITLNSYVLARINLDEQPIDDVWFVGRAGTFRLLP